MLWDYSITHYDKKKNLLARFLWNANIYVSCHGPSVDTVTRNRQHGFGQKQSSNT